MFKHHGSTDISTTYTFAATSATGLASGVTYSGGGYALSASSAGDSCAHPITFTQTTATNYSAATVTVTGTDANGYAITDAIAGPNGAATVTTTKRFATVTSVTIDVDTLTDTFNIGWTSLASTPWVPLDVTQLPFSCGVAAVLVSGSANYDLEHTYSDISTNSTAQVAFNNATMAAKTATSDVGISIPVRAVRLDINSHTSGVMQLTVIQPAAA